MDILAMPWANARVAHLLAVWRVTPVEVGAGKEEGYDTDDDNPLMYTQKAETLEPFSSHVIHIKTVKVYLGECLNMMVQALCTQDDTLPPGLTMENTYTKLRKGSKKAVVVVQNNMAYPQTLQKKTLWLGQYLHYQCLNVLSLRACKLEMICTLTFRSQSWQLGKDMVSCLMS